MKARLILNGKKAALESVRSAVTEARKFYHSLEIRVTYESGDIERMVQEAHRDGVTRIIAGGGDGTLNETVNALMLLPRKERPEMAIMPLGTANDFATSAEIPEDPLPSLMLALDSKALPVDLGKANDRYFLNVASGGFGAEVTSQTPTELKNLLGSGAYTLTGLIKALGFVPQEGKMKTENMVITGAAIVGAICNGREAGGGIVLAPNALIDDGLLDIIVIKFFSAMELPKVLSELQNPSPDGELVKIFQTPWIERYSEYKSSPINLDGEPYFSSHIRFEAVSDAIDLVLPENCPLLGGV